MKLKEAKDILSKYVHTHRGKLTNSIDTVLTHLKEQESGVLTSAPSRDKNFNYTKCYELALSKLDNLSDIELAYFITDWQNPQVKTTEEKAEDIINPFIKAYYKHTFDIMQNGGTSKSLGEFGLEYLQTLKTENKCTKPLTRQ